MTDSAVRAATSTAASCPRETKRRRRRLWFAGLAIGGLAVYLARAPLLVGLAGVLVTEGTVPANSVVVALDGNRSHAVAANALQTGQASAVLVYDRRPNRLVQRGLLPSVRERSREMYAAVGIDNSRQEQLEGTVAGLDDLIQRLSSGNAVDGATLVVLVCDEYRTRWLRRRVDRLLDEEAAQRFVVVGAQDTGVDRDGWWHSPVGRRVVITEWCRLLASLATSPADQSLPPLSDDELRAAGVAR
jgi:hypothetical protein